MKKVLALVLTLALTLGLTSISYAAYDNPYGSTPTTVAPAPGQPISPSPLVDGDNVDNGVGNANASGGSIDNADISDDSTSTVANPDQKNIIKSKGMLDTNGNGSVVDPKTNQRTHGAYQNNTNSCASCHQTHTGASKDLLIKRGVYNTCTACHDGTLGFYNVFKPSTAGTFGGNEAGNFSVHLATGTLTVDMAPGFNDYTGSSNKIATDNFDCASCHAPHGSYSDRLLHYSPNGMADIAMDKKGNKLPDMTVAASTADFDTAKKTFNGVDYVVFKTDVLTASAYLSDDGKDVKTVSGLADTDKVIIVLKKPATAAIWKWDNNPWVAGYEHAMNDEYTMLKIAYYTEFFNGATKVTGFDADGKMNGQLLPIYGLAYAKGTAIDSITKANIARAYVVKFGFQAPLGSFGGVPILAVDTNSYDEQGKGIAISQYCGACHTDYMTHSQDKSGSGVYRHSTDKDRFNCLKCHFAHGTDVTVMKDARDRDLAYLTTEWGNADKAKDYLLDKNPSSALKRYTNMAVCWKCHSAVEGKSSKLMNNTEYWTNYNTNPKGGNGTVGTYEPNWLNNSWE